MSADYSNISWPGWETIDLIGRGSFGAVYKIERKVFNDTEQAALKVISIPQNSSDIEEMYSDGYDNESITSTFQSHLESIVAEYSLMRKMNGCANIVNCDDVRYVQHDDGIGWDIFIKMELLTPLAKSLPAEISDEIVIKIAKDMCRALELCKKHGIVHRDIKPQNIFVSEHGDYKLGDFGIAKTVEKTTGGTKIGTYKYMAPEVYNNQPYGSAADIYSLGLVLYWLLNERRMPFLPLPPAKLRAGQDEDARHRRLSGEDIPKPAHGSDELKRIVLKACAYDTQDRYNSAALMLDDLNRLTGEAIVAGAVASVDSDETEQQEDELTTGPVFVKTQVQNSEPEEGEVDATVGPVFGDKAAEKKKPQPDENAKRKNGNKSFAKYALIALGVVAIVILLLLLKICSYEKPAVPNEGTDAQQLDWSDWQDRLPDYVTDEDYEIEEQVLYRSRTQETTSSTTQDTMDGWELYNTAEGGDYGSWSVWSTEKVTASETREVETQQQYRYRNKETTTSSAASKSGWEMYNTTYKQGNYGNWSNWSTTAVTANDSRQVETKKQYSYREKETTTSANSSLSGWTLYDTTYGAWGNVQTTTTKPTESDTLRITATTQTGWGYYHYCHSWSPGLERGTWEVDSCSWGYGDTYHTISPNAPLPISTISDRGGQQSYGGQGSGAPACGNNLYYWFRNPGADTCTYTYETRTKTNHFYKWSDKWSTWSDTSVSISSDREVKTQTLYRYRDREQIPTYHFWRWGSWSAWSENKVSDNNDRQVENITYYRYRDQVKTTTYYFRRWTDWSEYSEIVATPSETIEVETKTQYRFKSKLL